MDAMSRTTSGNLTGRAAQGVDEITENASAATKKLTALTAQVRGRMGADAFRAWHIGVIRAHPADLGFIAHCTMELEKKLIELDNDRQSDKHALASGTLTTPCACGRGPIVLEEGECLCCTQDAEDSAEHLAQLRAPL